MKYVKGVALIALAMVVFAAYLEFLDQHFRLVRDDIADLKGACESGRSSGNR